MDFDEYFDFLPEFLPLLPLYVGVLGGAALMQWVAKFYRATHERYGTVMSQCGLSGELVSQRLLAVCGLEQIRVVCGGPRDLYHPWKREIQLSSATFNNSSLAALVTAAHEVGHAQQFTTGILLCRLRRIFWPVCWILTGLAILLPVLPFLGLEIVPFNDACTYLLKIAVITIALQLPVQLPLEYDASRRARQLTQQTGLLGVAELDGFDKLTRAAWLTYAALEAQRWILVLVAGLTLWLSPTLFSSDKPELFAFHSVTTVDQAAPAASAQSAEGSASNHVVSRMEMDRTALDASDISPEPESDEVSGPESPYPVPTSASVGTESLADLFLLLLPNLVMLGVLVPVLVLLTKFAKGFEVKRTVRDVAIERCNAGLALHERGSSANAIAEFDEALRLDPYLAAAYYNRGHVYLTLDRLDEAMADMNTALRIEPGLIHAIVARGDVWLKRRDYDRAIAEYDAAHRLSPQNATVLTCRGFARLARSEQEQALADFELALQFNPKGPLAYAGRALVRLAREDFDRALDDCNQAAKLGSDDAILFGARGRVWMSKGDYDRAIAEFTCALERSASDASLLRDRGLARYFKDDCDRALADLNESIRLDPTDPVSFNNRGAARLKVGDYAHAAADLRESIRLNPQFPNPYKHLAWLQAACPDRGLRDGTQAVANANRALELTEWRQVEWFSVLAAAHAEAGHPDEAKKWQAAAGQRSAGISQAIPLVAEVPVQATELASGT